MFTELVSAVEPAGSPCPGHHSSQSACSCYHSEDACWFFFIRVSSERFLRPLYGISGGALQRRNPDSCVLEAPCPKTPVPGEARPTPGEDSAPGFSRAANFRHRAERDSELDNTQTCPGHGSPAPEFASCQFCHPSHYSGRMTRVVWHQESGHVFRPYCSGGAGAEHVASR
jgi:hypothetical protein